MISKKNPLKKEVDTQRSMLWFLGEIMKTAYETANFNDLMNSSTFMEAINSVKSIEVMKSATDMIMGVTGSNACSLWLDNKDNIVIFERNIYNNNDFKTYITEKSKNSILYKKEVHVYDEEEIRISSPNYCESNLPKSKIHVPIEGLGGFFLEHCEKDYFTVSKQLFLQTLGSFIGFNIRTTNMLVFTSKKSELDPMTQIYNRGCLDKIFDSIKAKNKDIFIALIDIDYFKSINDEKGHDIGDEIIKYVSKLLKFYIKSLDGEVIRYGGDEFVVIIPADENLCGNVLNIIRDTYKNSDIIKNLNLKASLTIGMTKYLPDVELKDLIKMADEALYKGKDLGKDIVVYNQNNTFKSV
ncbi:hypothetical protein AN639_04745 [Candidatus Epulonipiscium fishelsonii]|uniref:Uncharacterized protein n=1 Tax=Candidatus Epulonipiscium fishelsonii TaxID=77094 RepID=A0ACC8XDB5_9FIRM|nr:hypothetical protein AN639_04745 [Epulopiscium sp. SCG-B05WGA-EpuloA1]ONI40787.1 hypothetical protein AN396_05050 [Epulopiscium sp. SCG-B11WGA-EpuloA1]